MWVYRFLLTLPVNRPWWQRVAVMVVALAIAFAVRQGLAPWRDQQPPFPLFLPAILLIAWFGGARFGVVATVAVAVTIEYFLVWPAEAVAPDDVSQALALVIFLFNGLFVSLVCGALHRAVERGSAAAREADRQFEIMANNAPVLMWVADERGRGIFFNRSWIDFTGRPPGRHEGAGWFEDVHPEDRARCVRQYEEHLAARTSFRIEYRLRRGDGEYRWVLNHVVPRLGSEGEFEGLIGSCTDITDSRQEREELALLAELQSALSASLDLDEGAGVLVKVVVPAIADWAAIDLVGDDGKLSRVAARSREGAAAAPDEGPIEVGADFGPRHVLQTGEPRFIERIGDAVWGDGDSGAEYFKGLQNRGVISYLGLPLRVRGRVVGVLSAATVGSNRTFTARDIGLLRKIAGIAGFALDNAQLHQRTREALVAEEHARRELEVSERRFRSIWDSNVIGICVARRHGGISAANDAYLSLLCCSREDLPNLRGLGAANTPPVWLEEDEGLRRELNETGRCGPFEKECLRSDGLRVHILLGGALLPSNDECVVYALDLTALKTAERALQRQQELLRSMIDAVPAMIAYFDPDERCRVHNGVYRDLFGGPQEEIRGCLMRDVLPPETYPEAAAHFRTALGGGTVRFEQAVQHPLGGVRQMLTSFTPDRDAQGTIRGVVLHAFDITERKRTEAALAKNEERYRTLVRNTSAIVWTLDAAGIVSEEVVGWEGYAPRPHEPFFGPGWKERIHPEDLPAVTEAWRKARAEGTPFAAEFRFRTNTGDFRYVRDRAAPVLNPDGSVREWVGTIVDIHERTEARHALQRREAQLQLIIDNVPALISYVDRDFRYDLVNRAYERWFGLPRERLRGARVNDVVGEEAFRRLEPELQRVLSGRPLHRESYMPYTHGGPRWVEMDLSPHLDERGNVLGYVALIHDISTRKKIEHDLADALQRYRFLADAVPQIVWTAQPDGVFDYFNRRWFDYTGLKPEQCLGSDAWIEAIHEDDRERTVRQWREAVRTGMPFDSEHRLRRAEDGVFRWHLCRGMPRRDEQGTIVQWIGTSTDLDAQKTAFAELATTREALRHHAETLEVHVRERTARLSEANAELEAFSYSVSHDLRTPLQFIQGFSEAILEDRSNTLTAESQDYLQRIVRATVRMDTIIHDLLAYSRLSREEMRFDNVALDAVVQDVLAHHQATIQRCGAKMSVESPLPTVWAHPTALFQAVSNLVSNALKFTPSDRTPEVRIAAERVGGRVRLCVSDNGIGIDPQHHERIFKMFERLHGAGVYPGTGIGLSLVRKAVERMGGRISMESELGKGSRFCIDFPARH